MIKTLGKVALTGVILSLAGWLLYWSWCWGWWAPESLILRYLWQCQCPPQSEEARYPQRVDVLVPACMDTEVYRISPGGRYLLLTYPVRSLRPHGLYLYDVQSGELKPADWRFYQKFGFVTDDWLLEITPSDTYWLLNIHDSRRLPLRWIPTTPDHRLEPNVLHSFRSAEHVYVVLEFSRLSGNIHGHEWAAAVALATDLAHHPETNFVLEASVADITRTLEENGIPYQFQVPFQYLPSDYRMVSRNQLFRYSGHIYLASNNQKIVEKYGALKDPMEMDDFDGIGWGYQDRGVILNPLQTFVIGRHPGSLFVIEPHIWPVPQPILLLKVPKEYLSPELQQQEEARQAQEDATREQGAVTIRIGLGALVGVITLAMLWHHSGRRATGSNSQADVGR